MKNKIKKELLNYTFWAIVIFALSFLIVAILCLARGSEQVESFFFIGEYGRDFFMDFFNQLRDVGQGERVYTERQVIYPPMANLIFLVFAKIVSKDYLNTPFEARKTWSAYHSALISAMIFAFLMVFLIIVVYSKFIKTGKIKKVLLLFFILFSYPILFAFERGNVIIIAVTSLAVYIFTYNSQNKWAREIGLVCLALASSIKLYPIVLAITLIFDKRFKEILRVAIYGAILLIIPSFFFGGPIAIWYTIKNIFGWTSGAQVLAKKELILDCIFKILLVVGLLTTIGLCCFKQEKWKIFLVVLMAVFCLKNFQTNYMWAFNIAPLIMFLNSNKKLSVIDTIYFLGMIIPIATFSTFNSTLQGVVKYIGFATILGTSAVEVVILLIKKLKNKASNLQEQN